MSSSLLSVSYTLRPPSSTTAPPDLSPTITHEFPVQIKPESNELGNAQADSALSAHYAALREAIAQAKEVTGRELTKWRDAVGDGEKEKTGGKGEVDEEGEGGGEDGDEV